MCVYNIVYIAMRLMGFMMLCSFAHDVTESGCLGDGSAGAVCSAFVFELAVGEELSSAE